MVKINVTLITGRTLRQGQGKEVGKTSSIYKENVAICELDPDDLKALGVSAGTNLRIKTGNGSVVVKGLLSTQAPHKGVVFLPCGPWANAVIGSDTNGTGMPTFKGMQVEITPVPQESVLDVRKLLTQLYEG